MNWFLFGKLLTHQLQPELVRHHKQNQKKKKSYLIK